MNSACLTIAVNRNGLKPLSFHSINFKPSVATGVIPKAMIYIQESSLASQLLALEFLSGLLPCTLVLWNYPEVTKQRIPLLGSELLGQGFSPVTEYSDSFVPVHSRPRTAKPSLISYLNNFGSEIKASVDSICIYPQASLDWVACTIGHEGMCLVKDDTYLEPLLAKGFNASTKAPEWW